MQLQFACTHHGHECDGNLGLLRISVHFPGWNDCSVDIFNEFILDFYCGSKVYIQAQIYTDIPTNVVKCLLASCTSPRHFWKSTKF